MPSTPSTARTSASRRGRRPSRPAPRSRRRRPRRRITRSRACSRIARRSTRPAYDGYVAALPDGDAKTRACRSARKSRQIVALRADDGRFTPVTYTPTTPAGTLPRHRSGRHLRAVRATVHAAERLAVPRRRRRRRSRASSTPRTSNRPRPGRANSSVRTAEQSEIARFHTEPPPVFWTRNLRIFATADRSIAENARTLAALWTAQADVSIACFESKYPLRQLAAVSAITLARHGRQRGDRDRSSGRRWCRHPITPSTRRRTRA